MSVRRSTHGSHPRADWLIIKLRPARRRGGPGMENTTLNDEIEGDELEPDEIELVPLDCGFTDGAQWGVFWSLDSASPKVLAAIADAPGPPSFEEVSKLLEHYQAFQVTVSDVPFEDEEDVQEWRDGFVASFSDATRFVRRVKGFGN